MDRITPQELATRKGTEIGLSDWLNVDQKMIDGFADVTRDWQFIHVDPARAAAESPYGGTIAHGFLTLSLLPELARTALPEIEGAAMGVNYGFDRMRFVSPVPSGTRVRGRFVLTGCEERRPGELSLGWNVTVEIEGQDRPALVADWLTLRILEPAPQQGEKA
ncbi:MAG: MaoC family dehydratase [Rhodobacteraceae bacterium]|nr:MaoC family dehydratase [Paracoccaceae bacterium]